MVNLTLAAKAGPQEGSFSARLNRLLKNSRRQIPRELKSARNDENKGLLRHD